MATSLTFGSINISGLKDKKKRLAVFAWLHSLNLDIIFLQETHCHLRKEEKIWTREWGSQCFWSRGTNNSRGVAILFNKYKYVTENVSIDSNGRYIHCDLIVGENRYKMINIYAPNDEYERVQFINRLNSWIDPEIESVIGGDFNCTLNSNYDRKNCTASRDIGQIDLYRMMHEQDLEDVWRRRFPDKLHFSWNRGNKYSRIDYWLVSKSLDSQINNPDYIPCAFSDHSMAKINLMTSFVVRGPSFWKMNASLLKSDLFRKAFTSMWREWLLHIHDYRNENVWWDLGKTKIRDLARWCSFKLKQDQITNIKRLESILRNSDENTDRQVINKTRTKLKHMYEEIGRGAEVRSRVQWFEESEKPTRYFHSLEKCKGKEKSWDKILDDSGNTISGTDEILKVQVDFFTKLYTSQETDSDLQDKFCNSIDKKLSMDSISMLDKELELKDLNNALRNMKNNKSPGPDGLIVEFYKMYWDVLKAPLLRVYNTSFESGEMSYTQYLAIIILLYKKGVRELLKNWRPISLINVDTKLLSKIFANRVKQVLPEIIHTDQKGCIQGRFIGQNIRLVEDIINEMDEDKIILLLDQEKAFDRVEWDWLFKVLHAFSFGEKIIKWLKIMYKNMKSSVQTNGYISEYFPVTRGIRQGDSLSALLYVIQAEPLAQYIRNSNSIKGISIIDHEENKTHFVKSCQYVDDANAMLNNEKEVDICIEIIDEFGKASGSSLNKMKTAGLSNKTREWEYRGINISPGPLTSLGIPLGKHTDINDFWNKKLVKLKEKLDLWQQYDLSFIGKIYVMKSIGLSQIMYYLEMTTIDMIHLRRISDLLWKFLWKGKHVRIAKNICYLPRQMSGLGLPNIEILMKVRRIKMLNNVIKCKDSWNLLSRKHLCFLDNDYGNMPWFAICVSDSTEEILNSNIPLFYKECLLAYQELCRKGRKLCVWDNLLWCNSKIKHNSKVLKYKHWANSGILWLSDLGESEIDYSYKVTLLNKLTIKAGFIFEYERLEIGVKSITANQFATNADFPRTYLDVANDICHTMFEIPNRGVKSLDCLTSAEIYSILLLNDHIKVPSVEYWLRKFPSENIDFDLWFNIMFDSKICDRKCLDFNWRIYHGLLNTGNRLKSMGYSNGMCVICGEFIENTEHLLVNCRNVDKLWCVVEEKLLLFKPRGDLLTPFNKIVGILKDDHVSEEINMILSIVRWEIWKSRYRSQY